MNSDSLSLASSSKENQVAVHHSVVTIVDSLRRDEIVDIPICICKVPDSLSSANPEAYAPRKFGFGPYHHNRPELQQTEKETTSEAVKYFEQHFGSGSTYAGLVDEIRALAPKIRACYSSCLRMDDRALARLLATDALFLCKRLLEHDEAAGDAKRASEFKGFFRDAIMLENQVLILVLKKVLDIQFSSADDCHLRRVLWGCCKVTFPLDRPLGNYPWPVSSVLNHGHLLGLLYNSIMVEEKEEEEVAEPRKDFWTWMEAFDHFVNNILPNSLPPSQKIKIPAATRMVEAGVKFVAVDKIRAVRFHAGTASFHLPAVRLGPNSDVTIRNLVAYEQHLMDSRQLRRLNRRPGPSFTSYVELLEGLAATEEDVKVLKEQRIILSDSVEDEDVAKLFRNISGSPAGKCEYKPMDEAIKGVSEYCDGVRKVYVRRFLNKCLPILWSLGKLLLFLALMGMFCMSTVCSVLECSGNSSNNHPQTSPATTPHDYSASLLLRSSNYVTR